MISARNAQSPLKVNSMLKSLQSAGPIHLFPFFSILQLSGARQTTKLIYGIKNAYFLAVRRQFLSFARKAKGAIHQQLCQKRKLERHVGRELDLTAEDFESESESSLFSNRRSVG